MKNKPLSFFFTLFTLLHLSAQTEPTNDLIQAALQSEMTVDLKDPTYSNGILFTDKGGVIRAKDLYIQAKTIYYQKSNDPEAPIFRIQAQGALMMEQGNKFFIGDRLEYDFLTHEGIIYNGKLAYEPWYIGGDTIELRADNSAVVTSGFLTTSESQEKEWHIRFHKLHLLKNNLLKAFGIEFRYVRVPIFWMPSIRTHLKSFSEAPIKYHFQSGGNQGVKFGLSCRFLNWQNWSATLLGDYSLKRGLGGGVDVRYSDLKGRHFSSLSYVLKDKSMTNPHKKHRFRLQGIYKEDPKQNKPSLKASYDKFSDRDMPSSFSAENWNHCGPQKTEISLSQPWQWGFSTLKFRTRLNTFQTVKQQLPALLIHTYPIDLGDDLFFENKLKTEALNYTYGGFPETPPQNIKPDDYSSGRFSLTPSLYKAFHAPGVKIAPKIEVPLIYYTRYPSSVEQKDKCLIGPLATVNFSSLLSKDYAHFRHVIEPSLTLTYRPKPSILASDHYIFDLEDGLSELQMVTYAIKNSFNQHHGSLASIDFYAPTFLKKGEQQRNLPRLYADIVHQPWRNLKNTFNLAWDLEHGHLGYSHLRSEISVSKDIACAFEYRYRDEHTLRKVNPFNWNLDQFIRDQEKDHPSFSKDNLTDRRSTFLSHLFWRISPWWSLEFHGRLGWGRKSTPEKPAPSYSEFQVGLVTQIRGSVQCKLTVQRREKTGYRFLIGFSLKGKKEESASDSLPIGAENYY